MAQARSTRRFLGRLSRDGRLLMWLDTDEAPAISMALVPMNRIEVYRNLSYEYAERLPATATFMAGCLNRPAEEAIPNDAGRSRYQRTNSAENAVRRLERNESTYSHYRVSMQ